MTSKERMLAAYKRQEADRRPVTPEIWSATVLEYKGVPFHKYLGPFADEDYTSACEKQVRECMEASSEAEGFVLSTGDSVEEGTPLKNLGYLREYADNYGKR